MDRRQFVGKSMLAAGMASLKSGQGLAAGDTKTAIKQPMLYRSLGRTGVEVSQVSFGTYGWQNTPVLEAALDRGVNLVCTCADYQSGAAERAIGPAIAKRRDKVHVLSGIDCMRNPDEETMLRRLDESLEAMGLDYLDFYVPHQADTMENITNPAIPKAFAKMKAAGKAKYLGISTHSGQLEPMLSKAIDLGYFDLILCRYNFMEYASQMEIFRRAADKGIGVIVFKVRAGARENEVQALQEKGLELNQARVRWALSNQDVTSVCAHFSNFGAVDNYLDAISKKLSLDDSDILEEYRRAFDSSYCRNCSICAAACPQGVNVADVLRYKMYFSQYGFEKEAMERYAALPASQRPSMCDGCPAPCQDHCPHGLQTKAQLLDAAGMLSIA
jgi:predicted aldo/keto reductase-like oxidoreductase